MRILGNFYETRNRNKKLEIEYINATRNKKVTHSDSKLDFSKKTPL